jgi:hypothetical protein
MKFLRLAPFFCAAYLLHSTAFSESFRPTDKQPTIALETVALSADPTIVYQQGFPGSVTRTISSTDKIAFYYAAIRVINPSSEKVAISIECVDSAGREVVSKKTLEEVPDITISKYLDSKSGYVEASLGLNPAPNALVSGQKIVLKNEGEYYVRLIANGKLLALTKFRYFIEQKAAKNGKR